MIYDRKLVLRVVAEYGKVDGGLRSTRQKNKTCPQAPRIGDLLPDLINFGSPSLQESSDFRAECEGYLVHWVMSAILQEFDGETRKTVAETELADL